MDNIEFKKALALELIFAWEDSNEDVRKTLERVMLNVGIDKGEYWTLNLGNNNYIDLKPIRP